MKHMQHNQRRDAVRRASWLAYIDTAKERQNLDASLVMDMSAASIRRFIEYLNKIGSHLTVADIRVAIKDLDNEGSPPMKARESAST